MLRHSFGAALLVSLVIATTPVVAKADQPSGLNQD
jgi:hypothetical protein